MQKDQTEFTAFKPVKMGKRQLQFGLWSDKVSLGMAGSNVGLENVEIPVNTAAKINLPYLPFTEILIDGEKKHLKQKMAAIPKC